MKKVLYILGVIILITLLVIADYLNIITKLGLSISFWCGMVTGIFPIFLTIFLWKKEQSDRIMQITEETKFQKKLIATSQYMEYYESFLEQLEKYKIFIKSFLINENRESLPDKANQLIGICYLYRKDKPWNFDYRIFPFKAIDINISKYKYKENEINLLAYMPYIEVANKLNAIINCEELAITTSGGGYTKKLSDSDRYKKSKDLLEEKDIIQELYELLEYLKNDIEGRII